MIESSSKVQPYHVTTSPDEYSSWEWFQDYLELATFQREAKDRSEELQFLDAPLPVRLGERFCEWVMSTPEIRDIIYRRFVENSDNSELTSNLLGMAAVYFLVSNQEVENQSSRLSTCWTVISRVLKGEIEGPPNKQIRDQLLRNTWAFK